MFPNSPQDYKVTSMPPHQQVPLSCSFEQGRKDTGNEIEHLDKDLSCALYLNVDLCPYHFILRTVLVFKIPAKYSVLAMSAGVSQSLVWESLLNKRSTSSRFNERKICDTNLFCHCSMPECWDDMIQCELCEEWLHMSCEGSKTI